MSVEKFRRIADAEEKDIAQSPAQSLRAAFELSRLAAPLRPQRRRAVEKFASIEAAEAARDRKPS